MPRAIESCQSNSGLCFWWDFQWEMTCVHNDTHISSFSESLQTSTSPCSPHLQLYEYDNAIVTDMIQYCSGTHIISISRHCAIFPHEHAFVSVCVSGRGSTHTDVTCWPAPMRIFTRYNPSQISTICFIHANMCVPACTATLL